MRAMILAAGFGTRLTPITQALPKPLVPVVGVPNIVRTIHNLKRFNIKEIVINCHHLAEILEAELKDGKALGVSIEYSRETDILGTGGGVKKALSLLGDSTFVVVNGDSLFAPNIDPAVSVHKRNGALATLVLREDPAAGEYGTIGMDRAGRVRSMLGVGDVDAAVAVRMFTGVHVLEPEIGEHLPDSGCIVRETYVPLLRKGAALFGVTDNSCFFDLGTPRRYLDANIALVTGAVEIPGFSAPKEGVFVGENVEIGKNAKLGPGSVICDRARIANGVSIERSVVMPGAEVNTNLFESIATTSGEIVSA